MSQKTRSFAPDSITLTVSSVTSDAISVNWTAATGLPTGVDVTYRLSASKPPASETEIHAETHVTGAPGATYNYTDAGLELGVERCYRVRAKAISESVSAGESNEVCATTMA
jgi:hypothetical protein